jgi:hypothetical protein
MSIFQSLSKWVESVEQISPALEDLKGELRYSRGAPLGISGAQLSRKPTAPGPF